MFEIFYDKLNALFNSEMMNTNWSHQGLCKINYIYIYIYL